MPFLYTKSGALHIRYSVGETDDALFRHRYKHGGNRKMNAWWDED